MSSRTTQSINHNENSFNRNEWHLFPFDTPHRVHASKPRCVDKDRKSIRSILRGRRPSCLKRENARFVIEVAVVHRLVARLNKTAWTNRSPLLLIPNRATLSSERAWRHPRTTRATRWDRILRLILRNAALEQPFKGRDIGLRDDLNSRRTLTTIETPANLFRAGPVKEDRADSCLVTENSICCSREMSNGTGSWGIRSVSLYNNVERNVDNFLRHFWFFNEEYLDLY